MFTQISVRYITIQTLPLSPIKKMQVDGD